MDNGADSIHGTGTGRTVMGSWRGWGGVAAMTLACGVALSSAVAPLHGDDGIPPAPLRGVAQARYASTGTCSDGADPAASLDPALGSTDGPNVRAIVNSHRIRIGVDQNSYLWGFRDPARNDFAGFDIDLARAIGQDLVGPGGTVQLLTVPTDQRFKMLTAGKIDMVIRTTSITCARLADTAFSAAYFTAGQQLLVPGGSTITGYDRTLRGKRVCVANGSTAQGALDGTANGVQLPTAKQLGASQVVVPNQLDCLVRVQLGLADAVFTDNALAAGQAAQDPTMKLVGRPVTQEPYGVAMKPGKPDLVRRVNQILAGYEAGGSRSAWMTSYDKWLAADLGPSSGPPPLTYRSEP